MVKKNDFFFFNKNSDLVLFFINVREKNYEKINFFFMKYTNLVLSKKYIDMVFLKKYIFDFNGKY